MKKSIVALFLVVSGVVSAQITVTGTVKDSIGNPLEMANVIAINTQTNKLDTYTFTNETGYYKLHLSKNTNYTLKISYVGLQPLDLTVRTAEVALLKNITLQEGNALDEVNITYKMPVTIKGDTIVYNADSFTSGTEKKLGDVLKKLPGVEVNSDGEIEVEGKTVKKVMVEGKDFFDGDSKIAVKNIPASAIDKIEVLKNHSEVRQLGGVTDNEDNVVINIKLKEGKKSFWFGEVTAGAGLDNRFIAHPKLFYYSPKYSINVITDANNIGEMPFTRRDYFKFSGGFKSLHNSGTSFNLASNDIGFLTMKNNKAKEIDTRFAAANFSYSPKKTWDISGFAIYSGTDTTIEENSSLQYFNTENPAGITSEETQETANQDSKLALFKLSSSYKPDTNNQLDYDVFGKFSDQTEMQSLSSLRTYADGTTTLVPVAEMKKQNPFSINQNLNYYYTLSDQHIFAFEAQHLWQDEDPFYNARLSQLSFANTLGLANPAADPYDVSQDKHVKTNKFDAKLDYYYVLNAKSNINITTGAIVSNQQFDSNVFETLSGVTTPVVSFQTANKVDFSFQDFYAGVHYKFITGIFTFNQGLSAHRYASKNTQLGNSVIDDFYAYLPDASVKISLKKSESIRLNYNMQVSFTDVHKLAENYVFNNYNQLYSGNRDLESGLSHNLRMSYFSFNLFTYTNVFAFLNYNKRINSVKGSTLFTGVDQVSTSVNSAFPDETFSANVNIHKSIRKFKFTLGGNVSSTSSNSVFVSPTSGEAENIESKSFNQSFRTKVSSTFRTAPNFDIGYNVSINKSDQRGTTTTFTTHSPFVNFDALFLKHFTFTSKYTYNNFKEEETTINNYSFLDADITYQKEESKWEYKIGVTNLLNTKALYQNASSILYSSTSAYVIQPRYAVFSMRYNL